jgi:peptidoglycan/xylan/chitin deacetylase (PgdA/CDA1 family)
MVAITMDDGPSKDSQTVLDVLQKENAVVTFFYIGERVLTNPAAAQRAVSLGCELEDHTTDHVELEHLSVARLRYEVLECRDIIKNTTGETPVYVRPRSGRSDALGRLVVWSVGMSVVLWDVQPGDTIHAPPTPPDAIARDTIAAAEGGCIIDLHETNPATVAALPAIIRGLRARGFELVTLRTLLRGPTQAASTGPSTGGRRMLSAAAATR